MSGQGIFIDEPGAAVDWETVTDWHKQRNRKKIVNWNNDDDDADVDHDKIYVADGWINNIYIHIFGASSVAGNGALCRIASFIIHFKRTVAATPVGTPQFCRRLFFSPALFNFVFFFSRRRRLRWFILLEISIKNFFRRFWWFSFFTLQFYCWLSPRRRVSICNGSVRHRSPQTYQTLWFCLLSSSVYFFSPRK